MACGSFPKTGRIEIVAFSTSAGVCYDIDFLRQKKSEGGICVRRGEKWAAICGADVLCPHPVSWGSDGPRISTDVIGELSPSVRNVVVSHPGPVQGRSSRVVALIGRLTPQLQRYLEVNQPITVFAAAVPGCPPVEGLRVTAHSQRRSVKSVIAPNLAPGTCQPHRSSGPAGVKVYVR
jgi:hypothetical protein